MSYSGIVMPIKKKWFDLIASGEKKEEYRERKPYWARRLVGNWHQYNNNSVFYRGDYILPFGVKHVEFRNGYSKNAPTVIVELLGLEVKEPNPEWCEPEMEGGLFFALKLGEIISTYNLVTK